MNIDTLMYVLSCMFWTHVEDQMNMYFNVDLSHKNLSDEQLLEVHENLERKTIDRLTSTNRTILMESGSYFGRPPRIVSGLATV